MLFRAASGPVWDSGADITVGGAATSGDPGQFSRAQNGNGQLNGRGLHQRPMLDFRCVCQADPLRVQDDRGERRREVDICFGLVSAAGVSFMDAGVTAGFAEDKNSKTTSAGRLTVGWVQPPNWVMHSETRTWFEYGSESRRHAIIDAGE
ncbi:hypothetical protein C8R46DRAFT_1031752 [Mycena filopes]|nr:hypothetical protein C8R46DRAFT_1031752 [Mycena filopes]